jgi:methylisocitrate lyase
MNFIKNCQTFRSLLAQDCLMVPGAFNGMSGRLAAENGIF